MPPTPAGWKGQGPSPPSETGGEESFLISAGLCGGRQPLVVLSFELHPSSALAALARGRGLPVGLRLFFVRTLVLLAGGSNPLQYDLILTSPLSKCVAALFPDEVTFGGTGG